MAAKRHYDGMVGVPPERRKEMLDSMMISEDHSAPANLPQHGINKFYPKMGGGLGTHLDDTVTGIDSQVGGDYRRLKSQLNPKKI